ncbi:MAG: alanine racemase [Thermodesulfobacteriota bacterium]
MERYFNKVKVDLAALAHNLGQVRKLVGPDVRVMAMVKADGYGHGVARVGKHLTENGADALGVMDLHEAALLRDAGVKAPVYILAGLTPEQALEIVDLDLTPFVYDPGLAKVMDEAARRRNRKIKVQLKIDTGMHRLGWLYTQAHSFLETAAGLKNLEVEGLATHFAEADLKDSAFIQEQLERFRTAIALGRSLGLALPLNDAANSAATLTLPQAYFQMVRPGLMLYGDWPAGHMKAKADLRPAMSLTSRIIQIKTVPAGGTVSYGRTWTASRATLLATTPLGYIHGYNRLLSNKGWALIRGRRAPVLGRVCMNLTMFDVTDIPGAAVGDEVLLLGRRGEEIITGQDLADLIGTISYEVFCQVGSLNHREYI